jgi:hypothetical protein
VCPLVIEIGNNEKSEGAPAFWWLVLAAFSASTTLHLSASRGFLHLSPYDPGRFSKVSPHELSVCHSRILLTSRVVVSDANATMQVLSSTRMGSRR